MTVLIAGGGIGGLTLALSLHQIGVDCRVFESVAELKPLGVGINVLPHAVRELIELGLLDKLDASGVRTKRSEERRVGKECRRLCRSRWSPYH
jgi:2-polyprenyl-6-methoxyphenol hydroxylase-like FAD-dependent oxidoreductase